MKLLQLLVILTATSTTNIFTNASGPKLIYEADYSANDPFSFSDWVMEGPGEQIRVDKTTFNMRSLYQDGLNERWKELMDENGNDYVPSKKEINEPLPDLCEELTPDICDDFTKNNGKFVGGNIVSWIDKRFPKNIKIEYDFKSIDPIGLFIIFFAAHPDKKPSMSIFDESLPERNGQYGQYINKAISNYGISYCAMYNGDARGVSWLRKNAPTKRVKKGADYASEETGIWYSIKVIKKGKNIKFYIDDKLVLKYKDDKNVHGGGYIGFRQMTTGYGEYRDLKVYKL